MKAENKATTNQPTQNAVGVRGHRVQNEAKAEARRREILLGGARIFVRYGYQAAKLEDIAAESGLTKGHVYHYFLNKEQLFTEIVSAAVSGSVTQLEGIVAAGDGPEVTLRKVLEMHISAVFQPLERQANLLLYPPDLSAANRERIRQPQRRYEKLVQGILEDGIASGVFVPGDPKLMTYTLLRAAVGVAVWYQPGGAWAPDWIVAEVTGQLMRSVLAPAHTQPAESAQPSAGAEALGVDR